MAGCFHHRSMAKQSAYASAEFREGYEPPPNSKPSKLAKRTFAELMAEVGFEVEGAPKKAKKDRLTPKESRSTTTNLYPKEEKEKEKPKTVEEYNPSHPFLPNTPLFHYLKKKSEVDTRIAERATTAPFQHTPHLLSHIISNTPHTNPARKCNTCTPSHKCKHHAPLPTPYTPRTSVSLCKHTYMTLTWCINDPSNSKSTWKLEIRDFGIGEDIGKWEHANDCKPYRPSERARLLAQRVVEDLGDWRVTRREVGVGGSVGRVEREVRTLIGAWERAKGVRIERKERVREREREAREKLGETLRVVREMEEGREKDELERKKAEGKKSVGKEIEVEDVGVGATETAETLSTPDVSASTRMDQSTEVESSEPDASETSYLASSENQYDDEPPTPKSPAPLSPLDFTLESGLDCTAKPISRKRRRSSESGRTEDSASSTTAKRVRFTSEIEAAHVMVESRVQSSSFEADFEIEQEVVKEQVTEEKVIEEKVIEEKIVEGAIVQESTLSPVEGSRSMPDSVEISYDEEDELEYEDDELEYEM